MKTSNYSVTSSLVKDFKRDLTNIQLIQSPFSVLQACGCESELSVTPLERWYATRGESEGSFLCSYFWGEATVGDDKIDMFGTGQKERWAEEARKWRRKRFQILPYWENIFAMGRSVFRNPDTIINLFLHFTERSASPKHISGDVLKDIVSGKLGLHENER